VTEAVVVVAAMEEAVVVDAVSYFTIGNVEKRLQEKFSGCSRDLFFGNINRRSRRWRCWT
jgi:hypothetical protein